MPTPSTWDVSRRSFLQRSAYGLGGLALAAVDRLRTRPPRRPSRIAGEAWSTRRTCPSRRDGVIHLCMAGGPSQFETLDYKPMLSEIRRPTLSRIAHEGPAARAAARLGAADVRAGRQVSQARAIGPGDLRLFPAHRRHRRRHLHRPLDGDRADQPRPRASVHELGLDLQGTAEHGLVAALRPGRRDRQSARVHRAGLARQRRRRAARLGPAMVQRLPAGQVPGGPVPVAGRRRPLHRQPRRGVPEHAAAGRRGGPTAQRDAGRRSESIQRSTRASPV